MLDQHVPKKRYIRSNHKPFINNQISKAIMARGGLRNRFFTKQK